MVEIQSRPFSKKFGAQSMNHKSAILVVDDDIRICRLLERYLSKAGYQVSIASNGEQMYQSIQRQQPDLILLDLELPGTHGLDLAKDLRQNSKVGIIILTGTGVRVDKVVGLEIGVDDYVEKPFDQRELLARIRSVLRRVDESALKDHSIARFSSWTVDLTARRLVDEDANEVTLTGHEYQLLEILIANANNVIRRDQIMSKIKGRNWIPSDRSVDVLVGKLRKKIERSPHKPDLIKTIRGAGYILTARVEFSS